LSIKFLGPDRQTLIVVVDSIADCLPMITSLEDVTDAEEFQAYLDWITIEFDEDRMDSAEAQRRLFEARRFLFELRPDFRERNDTMANQR
jgi:hypothetical protein